MVSGLLNCVCQALIAYLLITFITVSYSMPNFVIGTRDVVEVSVDASCCAAGITIRAVDIHDNEVISCS